MNDFSLDIPSGITSPGFTTEVLPADINVTQLDASDLNQLDLENPAIVSEPPDLNGSQEVTIDYSEQIFTIQQDLSSLSEGVIQLQSDLVIIRDSIGTCSYLLCAILFIVLFWFCYNRIRNAARMFTGRKSV